MLSLDSSSLWAIPQELPQCCINRLSVKDIFLQISFCSLYFQEGCSRHYFLGRVKGGDRIDINWSASYVSSYIIDAIKNLGDKGLDKQQSAWLLYFSNWLIFTCIFTLISKQNTIKDRISYWQDSNHASSVRVIKVVTSTVGSGITSMINIILWILSCLHNTLEQCLSFNEYSWE